MLLTTLFPYTSPPSTEELKKEQEEETKVVIAAKELQTTTKDIKDDKNKDDFTTNLDEVECRTCKVDHTLEEVDNKGTKYLSMDRAGQMIQEAKKKEGQADSKDVDLMNYKPNHPLDLMIVPEDPHRSLEDNYIVLVREKIKSFPFKIKK